MLKMTHKPSLMAAGLALASCGAFATEYGHVISSTPVTAQVPVSHQQCVDQQQVVPQGTTGGGAVAGAIIGGLAGHAIGYGAGRAAATAVGAVTGAVVGNGIEAANTPPVTVPVRTCGPGTSYQEQVVGYDVAYEYNGQTYHARLANPPGDQIALHVAPVDALAPGAEAPYPPAAPVAPGAPAAPVAVYPAVPYYPYYGAYPAAYPYPYVPYAVVGWYGYGYRPYPYYYYRPGVVVGGRWGYGYHH
jgi:uncharacterized protein YcfJ